MLIKFFNSQGVVRKEFVPQRKKKLTAEFYNGLIDRLLKRIYVDHADALCSRDFFLLHDNAPTHKSASVCLFLTHTALHLPLYLLIYLRQTIFPSPS